ncbi:hypothetical protein, partial [Pseudomonas aeruginosa]
MEIACLYLKDVLVPEIRDHVRGKNRYQLLGFDHPGHSVLQRADYTARAHTKRTWPMSWRR